MSNNRGELISLTAEDGWPLAGRFFPAASPARAAVLIGAATGVPQRYYAPFARALAESGLDVLTVDYRGIAESATEHPRRTRVLMEEWGRYDLDAGLAWLRRERAPQRLLYLGHSVGGQVLPFAREAQHVDAILLIASQSGHWRNWSWRYKPVIALSWYFVGPVLTRALGYLPKVFMGGGEPLPGPVARQWARWGRHPDYLLGEHPSMRETFASFRVPMVMVSIEDDALYAPSHAVDALASWYTGATLERWHWRPSDFDLDEIGHFGFFHRRHRETLWPLVREWLVAQAATEARQALAT